MRTRAKALTVAAAMVTTFVILPTFGAAAAEPLEDGSYDVVIGETTHTVDVLGGVPAIDGAEGVEFTFAFDDETNRVLDEFVVTVDGVAHDVAVADDGTVTVTEAAGEEPAEEPEDGAEEPEDDGEDLAEGDDEDGEDGEPLEEDDEDGDEDGETLEEGDEDGETLEEGDEDGDEVGADGGHGAIVSTVARCAPNGKQARAAGVPNHGFFVRAAAKGEVVEFEANGEAHSADLSSQEGADAFCALADELLAAPSAAPDVEGEGENAGGKGKGRGNGNGRAAAPGQLKKNG